MNNPFNFMQFISNPQEFLRNAMNNNQIMSNPMAKNAIELCQKGDTEGLQNLARNMCKERGINADEAIKQLKKQYGI